MEVIELLNTLMTTPGPAGREGDLAIVIGEMWQPYVDNISSDAVGNLIAFKEGSGAPPRPRVLLTAHMDEIALMVQTIESYNGNGFLRVVPIGGIDLRQLYGQRVVVHGRRNVNGVVGAAPTSMLESVQSTNAYGYDELVVDVGLPSDRVNDLIRVGDFITFSRTPHRLLGKRIAGKALDNRASIAALTVALDHLQQRQHQWDLVVAATVQEELRLAGAHVVGHSQQPHVAVSLDVCFARQPGVSEGDAFELGSGPVLDVGVHVNQAIFERLQAAARTLEMKTNTLAHARSSGTETGAIQLAQAGVPTGLLSIPIRYMHTAVETVAPNDIERSGRLLAEFVAGLDGDFLQAIGDSLIRPESKEQGDEQ